MQTGGDCTDGGHGLGARVPWWLVGLYRFVSVQLSELYARVRHHKACRWTHAGPFLGRLDSSDYRYLHARKSNRSVGTAKWRLTAPQPCFLPDWQPRVDSVSAAVASYSRTYKCLLQPPRMSVRSSLVLQLGDLQHSKAARQRQANLSGRNAVTQCYMMRSSLSCKVYLHSTARHVSEEHFLTTR